jgi:AraC family transcriptional regulator of adaptative response/methylated-DNA-[protein]-cysteine methyltransferase
MNSKNLTFNQKYDIILRKDKSYEGIFFTAVKSTGIFCRPTCTARKPKKENVEFYETAKEALINGFRPCKLCKPQQSSIEPPKEIVHLLAELHHNPFKTIKDQDLRNKGIEPNRIRRWFKKEYGMTFQGYQRMIRINGAFQSISSGEQVTSTAFDSGYESLSGFNDMYKRIFGITASKNRKSVINLQRFVTPLGPMFCCATNIGICLLEFTNRRGLENEWKDLCRRFKAVILPGFNEHLKQMETELAEYFDGKRMTFTVSLDTPGTDFQVKVWEMLREIPYGETRSYLEQAKIIGDKKAVRAVARANGMNRVAIVIPCHRVVGSNGQLTGYAGGLDRKKWLLEFENDKLSRQLSFFEQSITI